MKRGREERGGAGVVVSWDVTLDPPRPRGYENENLEAEDADGMVMQLRKTWDV